MNVTTRRFKLVSRLHIICYISVSLSNNMLIPRSLTFKYYEIVSKNSKCLGFFQREYIATEKR